MKSAIHAWYQIFVKNGVSYQEWLRQQPLMVKKLGSRPILQTVRLGDIRPKHECSFVLKNQEVRFLDREQVRVILWELTRVGGTRREIVLIAVEGGGYKVDVGREKVGALVELVGEECYVEVLVYE